MGNIYSDLQQCVHKILKKMQNTASSFIKISCEVLILKIKNILLFIL